MITYSGWVEAPKGEAFGGGTVRIPFTFNSGQILSDAERRAEAIRIYTQFTKMITDYDDKRQGQYGDPGRVRFTSVEDVPHPSDDPYSGIPVPEPHIGR